MNAPLLAGALSGIAGLLTFLIIHHITIQPIWYILPFGFVFAVFGGMAVGWAYELLKPGLPPGNWTSIAFASLIMLILAPALVLPHFRTPIFLMTPEGAQLVVSTGRAIFLFIIELVVTSTIAGAFVGWWIGQSHSAVLRTALAGLIFALGPGHNIPLISGAWGGVLKSWVLLLAIILVSSVVLVVSEAVLNTTG